MSEYLVEVLDWIKFVRPEGGVSMNGAIGEREMGSDACDKCLSMVCTSMFPWLMHWTIGGI